MASALQLLRGERYELEPSYRGNGTPMGQPMSSGQSAPAMVPDQPQQPSYAQLLAGDEMQGGDMPMEPQGSVAISQPVAARPEQAQQPMAGGPDWMTPERKRMYEKAKRAATNYRMAVDARRQKRKQSREYGTLYNQMQNERGKVDQIENMMTTYKDLFRPDDPRTESMIRQQMQHFETAERLKNDLRRRLQKAGVKIGPKDTLPEDPWGGDDGDEQFDRFIMQGYNDALMSDPYR